MAELYQVRDVQARLGTVKGLRSPSLAVRLTVVDPDDLQETLLRAVGMLTAVLPPSSAGLRQLVDGLQANNRMDPEGSTVLALGTVVQWIIGAAGVPVTEMPKVFRLSQPPSASLPSGLPAPRAGVEWACYIPAHAMPATRMAFDWLAAALRQLPQKTGYANGNGNGVTALAGLDALLADLAALVPPGVNTRQFLTAAQQLDIPAIPRAGGIWQYGMGRHGRLMLSSLTDRTPSIGVKLARSKSVTNAFLREAGLPVPDQVRVANADDAVAAAERMGYPVVIKPAALDGGQGVAAGLMSAASVRRAWGRAIAVSDDILLERHVPGSDFRVNVFEGEVMFAVERIPGGVTGDGQSSVQQLIEAENRDPRRRTERWSQMVPLVVNDEATELLAEQGLALADIPEAGRRVRLRRTANVSRGGTTRPVIDEIHIENRRLAARAAAALRLDLAGIDLLMPDISRPWHEQGGVICEVNAQVQMGLTAPQQFAQILGSFMQGRGAHGTGRVPIVVCVTGPDETALVPSLARAIAATGLTPGAATPSRLVVGASIVSRPPPATVFDQAMALLCDPSVDCLLIEVTGPDLLRTGLPFDRFDLLHIGRGLAQPSDGVPDPMRQVLQLLVDHCQGEIRLSGPAISDAGVRQMLGTRTAHLCPEAATVTDWHAQGLHNILAAAEQRA